MKELELYIHIPFCVKKCDYCDFLSFSSTKEERQAYVDALIREVKGKKEWAKAYQVTSIFFGGGTPSILEETQTKHIMDAISDSFLIAEDAEITTEMNPGTATKEKLQTYQEIGFNRLSIGLQSTQNKELKRLGRIHTYEEFLQCYKDARAVGFQNINVDLMSAIPTQTMHSYEENLKRILTLAPEHISAYSLIIEEGTPFYEQYDSIEEELPDEEQERMIYHRTKEILNEHGYERYEISNYAKPGMECKHNLGYWECKEYLGLGLGASSLLDHRRLRNTEDMISYMEGTGIRDEEELSKEMEMEEFCFLGLRKIKGIRIPAFKQRFGLEIESIYGEVIQKQKELGLLVQEDDYLKLTDAGIDVSNLVMSEFIITTT